jgi:hypothetical protein
MNLYLSGPMSGLPEMNFPMFNAAAAGLRRLGYTVFNPAETDGGDTSQSYAHYMRKDIEALLSVDAVVVLPGWQKSRGAILEVSVAKAFDLPILKQDVKDSKIVLVPIEETALQEAQRLVHGDRNESYGHPLDDFSKTALIWQAIFGHEVTPEQVALCMVGVKISREVNKPARDNRVDGAGYFETLNMVHEERLRRISQIA